jgi:hypothetical protein
MLIGLILAWFPQDLVADPARWPVANSDIGNISSGFFDPDYPGSWSPPAQHLGTDIPSPQGTSVVSPINGRVLLNRTDRSDPFEKHLIVLDIEQEFEHVFGHIDSPLEEGYDVRIGDPLGQIVSAGTGPHLHWGINSRGVLQALGAGWGWGRAPVDASRADADARGWLDPAIWLSSQVQDMDTPWVICNDDRSMECLLAASIDIARETGNQEQIVSRLLWASETYLKTNDPENALRYAIEARNLAFSSPEQNFQTVVRIGAALAAAGSIQDMRQVASTVKGSSGALHHVLGRLARDGHIDIATELAPEAEHQFARDNIYKGVAIHLLEKSRISLAEDYARKNIEDAQKLAGVIAHIAAHLYRAGDKPAADRYLAEAMLTLEPGINGSSEIPLVRALMLSGNENAAYDIIVAHAASTWSEFIRGQAAAGAAEAGNIETAIELTLSLKDSEAFREYNRMIAYRETIEAFVQAGRLSDIGAFIENFEPSIQDAGWQWTSRILAMSGDFDGAARVQAFIRDETPRNWARMGALTYIARNGDIPAALNAMDDLTIADIRAQLLTNIALTVGQAQ